jgi:hypothetical protein
MAVSEVVPVQRSARHYIDAVRLADQDLAVVEERMMPAREPRLDPSR